jgi:hypothetical protein
MDLAEIFRVMRRRWYVLLPGLLLTTALTAGAYLRVPITYESQSTVVLLNSQKATAAFNGNPFLSTQISLTGMADSLARNLNSDASVAALHDRGARGTSVAKIADNALGPLMWLTVTGTDKDTVLSSDRLLTAYAAERLEQFQLQQSVQPKAMIRMATIVPPQNPVAKTKTRSEYLVLAALMGIVISLVATFYVEARRRTAAAGTTGTGAQSDPADTSAPGDSPASGDTSAPAGTGRRRKGAAGRPGVPAPAAGGDAPAAAEPSRPARSAPRWSAGRDGAHRPQERYEDPEGSDGTDARDGTDGAHGAGSAHGTGGTGAGTNGGRTDGTPTTHGGTHGTHPGDGSGTEPGTPAQTQTPRFV